MAACAVVELASGEECHGQENYCHHDRSRDRSGRDLPCKSRYFAECDDKENAHQCAQDRQNEGGDGQGERESLDAFKCPGVLLDAQHAGNIVGRKGGDDAGDQGVVLQKADVADLHSDNGGGQRRAEQSGESGAHAGHDHDPPGAFGEMESFAHLVAEASADLQRGAFSAHRSAQEVGQYGGAEDERRHCSGNALIAGDREQNGVGSLAVVELLVEEDDQRGADGHQEDDPGVFRSQFCGVIDAQRENAGDEADKRAAQKSVDQEFDHLSDPCFDLEKDRFQLVSEVAVIKVHNFPLVSPAPADWRVNRRIIL